jgi:hypothetical protein
MGRPRKFASEAEKQRTYRLQRKIERTDAETLHHARLAKLHRIVLRAASDGDEGARKVLGVTPSDTALKIIMDTQRLPGEDGDDDDAFNLTSFAVHYYAFEEAASSVLLRRSEMKDGIFQVVIGTEKRAPKKAQTKAERPKPPGKIRARDVSKSSRTAPKSRKTA